MKWNYFTDEECEHLDTELMAMLDKARHKAGVPFIITDGFRTGMGRQDRNAVNNSAHLSGKAVDLRCRDSVTLFKMLDGIITAGFKRIGIYFVIRNGRAVPTHIHIDNDVSKPMEVTWLTLEQ